MSSVNILHSERLVLRPLRVSDRERVLFLRGDEEMNRFITRKRPTSLTDADDFIQLITATTGTGDAWYWAIQEIDDDVMIGSICLWNLAEDRRSAEVGYDLHPTNRGKGIMTEALRTVMALAYEKLGMSHLDALTQFENAPSIALLEKVGFSLIPDARDEGFPKNRLYRHRSSG